MKKDALKIQKYLKLCRLDDLYPEDVFKLESHNIKGIRFVENEGPLCDRCALHGRLRSKSYDITNFGILNTIYCYCDECMHENDDNTINDYLDCIMSLYL